MREKIADTREQKQATQEIGSLSARAGGQDRWQQKLFQESERKPITIGQPKLPSLEEQVAFCDPSAICTLVPGMRGYK